MTIILIVAMMVCGLMMMFGATKWALSVVIVSVVGCFCYRIWFAGEDMQSVFGGLLFCFMLLPLGLYGAKQFINAPGQP